MKTQSILILTLLTALVSCTKEPETNKDIRTDFLGTWKCTQSSKLNGSSEFLVSIKIDSTHDSRINMFNFYNIGSSKKIYANISTVAAKPLSMPFQPTGSSEDIEGDGSDVSSTKLTFDYVVDDGNAIDSISAIFIKQ